MVNSLARIPIERRWRGQSQPVPVVISIIRRFAPNELDGEEDAHYLLIRRNSGPYSDHWALVGGKWDFGESLSTAAVREVEEESGLSTTYGSLLGLVNERVRLENNDELGGAHFLIFVCQVEAGPGEAQEQNEGAVAWFTRHDIDQLNEAGIIIPSDYAMLMHFVGGDAIPHFEVEMDSLSEEHGGISTTNLTRFERLL